MTKELPTIYLAVGSPTEKHPKGERSILAVTYTPTKAVCRRHYSGEVVATAGGGGYDRASTALANALAVIYGIPYTDGGCGETHVVDHARAYGVAVYRLSEALYVLPGVEATVTA